MYFQILTQNKAMTALYKLFDSIVYFLKEMRLPGIVFAFIILFYIFVWTVTTILTGGSYLNI